jgi:agmatinase
LTTKDRPEIHSVFLGIPDDSQSTYRRGCSQGPQLIRSAYDGRAFNSTTELGIDLADSILDLGDVEPADSWPASAERYRSAVESVLRTGRTPFIAGGDHAVTVPVVEAMRVLSKPVHVIHIDAHPDLYAEYEGSASSHACVIARLLEMDHVVSVTQLGIRALNDEQSKLLAQYQDRVHVLFARDLPSPIPRLKHLAQGAPVYLTLDMDGLDPTCAPGVSHPVPGGLSSRQVLSFLQNGHWNLVAWTWWRPIPLWM